MAIKRAYLIGCGVALGLVVLVAAAIVGWLMYVAVDPEGVAVATEAPAEVRVGEEFTMAVIIMNEREKKPFHLTDIDIAEEYLEGFIILGSEPRAKSNQHVPFDNTRSFSFNRKLPPRESMRFEFRLRPRVAGFYSGDVDVCEGQRFLSAGLQTQVVRVTGRRPGSAP